MITAPIGPLASEPNTTNPPQTPQTDADFERSLRSIVEGGHAAASGPAYINTTTSLSDVQDLISEFEPLTDWKHFVFGRTNNGKYEYISVAIPDREITNVGYNSGPFRDQLSGFDFSKISPSHPDGMNLKYVAARIFEQINVQGLDPVAEAIAVFNEVGIPATQAGDDKIDFGDGQGPIDVIRNMTSGTQNAAGGRAWQWLVA